VYPINGETTRLELYSGPMRVRIRIELVHVKNYERTVTGGLEGDVGLVFARDGSFPLSGGGYVYRRCGQH
jgi:hypothetical protein